MFSIDPRHPNVENLNVGDEIDIMAKGMYSSDSSGRWASPPSRGDNVAKNASVPPRQAQVHRTKDPEGPEVDRKPPIAPSLPWCKGRRMESRFHPQGVSVWFDGAVEGPFYFGFQGVGKTLEYFRQMEPPRTCYGSNPIQQWRRTPF